MGKRGRGELVAFLEIFALCGFAVAQPVLDVVGRSPDFLLFHRIGRADIALLLVAVALVPPVALWGATAALGAFVEPVRRTLHAGLVGLLLALIGVQVGKHVSGLRGLPLALVAVAGGVGLAGAYVRWRLSRQLLRFAAVGPPLFAVLFVFASPASPVLLAGGRPVGGPVTRTIGPHPPVVMVLLDEFPLMSLLGPDGQIDAQKYPNFARLARGSTWYRNATAVSGWTPYAVPAMLTGRYPTREGLVPHYATIPENLYTLFDGVYDLDVHESVTQLCPPTSCVRAPRSSDALPAVLKESASLWGELVSPKESHGDPTASLSEPIVREETMNVDKPDFRFDRIRENQPARFSEFLAGIAADDGSAPTAHVLHLLMPHTPWTYLPSGTRYEVLEDLPNDGDDPWWGTLARERHLLQVRYTDRLLGEVLRVLSDSGRYAESLLVVTADHGLSFARNASGRLLDKEQRAAPELMWVPLFIKEPRQVLGRVDDRNWQQVDLLPTVADLAGIEVPWAVNGISAGRGQRPDAAKEFYPTPGAPATVDGSVVLPTVLAGGSQPPRLPLPSLVGRRVDELPITDGGPALTVANLSGYREVHLTTIPALVWGGVPDSVPDQTLLAFAVNGRIGAVAPVVPPTRSGVRFAALMPDESLFVAGANKLEVFLVRDGGASLQRANPHD